MNSLIITRGKICTESAERFWQMTKLVAVFAAAFSIEVTAHADWAVDFTRRAKAVRENDLNDAAIGHAEFNPIDYFELSRSCECGSAHRDESDDPV